MGCIEADAEQLPEEPYTDGFARRKRRASTGVQVSRGTRNALFCMLALLVASSILTLAVVVQVDSRVQNADASNREALFQAQMNALRLELAVFSRQNNE